jgi:hypothetical protein
VLGASFFLLAIAPLGIGSGFPFSVIAIASLLVMEWGLRPGHPLSRPQPSLRTSQMRDHHEDRSPRQPIWCSSMPRG